MNNLFRACFSRLFTALTTIVLCLALSAQAHAQKWDHTDIKYGTDDPSRQWLNIRLADTVGPAPIYMFAHGNGGSANGMSEGELQAINNAGFATVSWESVPTVSSPADGLTVWADAQLMFDWVRANAATYNLDADNIVIGGRSRGSGGSWPLAHSGHPAIKGIYMYNALPRGFWQSPEQWTPVDNVTANAPHTYFTFGPNAQSSDGHNPVNAYPVRDRYIELGIGHKITFSEGMWDEFYDESNNWTNEAEIMEYFATLVSTLPSPVPPNMTDNFDGTPTGYPWAETGSWNTSGGTYNKDAIGYENTYAGNSAWDSYTFQADMLTVGSADPSVGWMASSLAFRVSDSGNMYRMRLHNNGSLKLSTIVDGASTEIASVATGYSPFAWHTYKIQATLDNIQVSIDDELLININDSDHPIGRIGVRTSQSSVSVDNLSVIQPPGC